MAWPAPAINPFLFLRGLSIRSVALELYSTHTQNMLPYLFDFSFCSLLLYIIICVFLKLDFICTHVMIWHHRWIEFHGRYVIIQFPANGKTPRPRHGPHSQLTFIYWLCLPFFYFLFFIFVKATWKSCRSVTCSKSLSRYVMIVSFPFS